MDELKAGLYEPSEIERENCENGKCCDFGICDECTIGYGKSSKSSLGDAHI